MKAHRTLARTLLFAFVFLWAPLCAQQTIAVLPPLLADKDVNDGMRNAAVAGFSEYISAPGSGYKLYSRLSTAQLVSELANLLLQSVEGKSAAQLMREMERSGSLYDEGGAKALGGKLGVPYVCISKLMKETKVVLECKVINVGTGAVRGDSEYVAGGISEMRVAGAAVIKRLLETSEGSYAEAEAQAMAMAAAAAANAAAAAAAANAAAAAAKAAADLEEAMAAKAGVPPSVYTIHRNGDEWHYWKDNQEVEPYRYDGFSIGPYCQSGGDTYRGTWIDYKSAITKNGSLLHFLTQKGSYEGDVSTVVVSDDDVYAGGGEKNQRGNYVATVWKNGNVLYRLTDGGRDALVYAVCVSGGDVYAGGREKNAKGINVATIWKNGRVLYRLVEEGDRRGGAGVADRVAGGAGNAAVNALFVKGGDVYASRWDTDTRRDGNLGMIWKNGKELRTLNPDGKSSVTVWSIFVHGSDVYASGFQGYSWKEPGAATVWKNGEVLYSFNSTGYADRSLVFVRYTRPPLE